MTSTKGKYATGFCNAMKTMPGSQHFRKTCFKSKGKLTTNELLKMSSLAVARFKYRLNFESLQLRALLSLLNWKVDGFLCEENKKKKKLDLQLKSKAGALVK